jgi:polyphosphate kinase
MSENIRVRSIVGRFLEHSRVMSFTNGGEPEFWLGSADLMHRNLDRRVEVLLRVCDETARVEIQRHLDATLAPGVRCWELGSDGSWRHLDGEDIQAAQLERVGELSI